MTQEYHQGDRVRVTVPDPVDPDHRYHGAVGTVTAVHEDCLSVKTGDSRDDYLYRVEFERHRAGRMWFRHDDLDRVLAPDRPENGE